MDPAVAPGDSIGQGFIMTTGSITGHSHQAALFTPESSALPFYIVTTPFYFSSLIFLLHLLAPFIGAWHP